MRCASRPPSCNLRQRCACSIQVCRPGLSGQACGVYTAAWLKQSGPLLPVLVALGKNVHQTPPDHAVALPLPLLLHHSWTRTLLPAQPLAAGPIGRALISRPHISRRRKANSCRAISWGKGHQAAASRDGRCASKMWSPALAAPPQAATAASAAATARPQCLYLYHNLTAGTTVTARLGPACLGLLA